MRQWLAPADARPRPAATGDEIVANGKSAGTLLTRAGDRAIAYLRFDRAGEEMQAGEATVRLA